MNNVRTAVRKGFTLVEILIVVVILGILAAIVIPQFSSASQAAQASSLVTQLQSLRSQLELYQLQHEGNYPAIGAADGIGADGFWDQLTGFTNQNGVTYATQTAADDARGNGNNVFGPYLQKPISNPFITGVADANQTLSTSADEPLGTTGVAGAGYLYNPATGEIKANVPFDVAREVNFDAADGDVAIVGGP